MKKLLTIAALVGVTSLSFGQGYIQFANNASSRYSTNTPASAHGTGFLTASAQPAGTAYYFALFAAPSTQNTISTLTDPTLSGWTFVHMGTNTAQAGRLSGNDSDAGAAAQIPGFAANSTADFAIAGWTANIGTTWAEAQAWWANGTAAGSAARPGWFGINSTIANDAILLPFGSTYNGTFGSTAALMNGFGLSFYQVPEPTGFALAGLGAAVMLIFRRRKA